MIMTEGNQRAVIGEKLDPLPIFRHQCHLHWVGIELRLPTYDAGK